MMNTTRRLMCATLLAAWLIAAIGCGGPRPVETIRMAGDQRFERGDYAGAADEYAEITARYPGDWQAQYKLGMALMKTGDLSAARRALEIAYTRQPDNQEVAGALAEAMFQQGDEARLFAFLRDRAATSRKTQAYLDLGRYAVAMNDMDSAQTAFDTAIEVDLARNTEPYYQAALLAERLGHLDVAVRRLRQALDINPHDRRVLEKLRELGEDPSKIMPLPPGR